jgi:hypothetical protein
LAKQCVNKEIQVEHLCFDNEHDLETPTLCFDDDLTNQSISHIQNTTFLETNRQIQPQDHGLSQIFHSYTYNEEVDYAKKDDVDLYDPLMIKYFMMMNGQIKLMKTLLILLIHKMSFLLKILMKLIKVLKYIMLIQIHCFN